MRSYLHTHICNQNSQIVFSKFSNSIILLIVSSEREGREKTRGERLGAESSGDKLAIDCQANSSMIAEGTICFLVANSEKTIPSSPDHQRMYSNKESVTVCICKEIQKYEKRRREESVWCCVLCVVC